MALSNLTNLPGTQVDRVWLPDGRHISELTCGRTLIFDEPRVKKSATPQKYAPKLNSLMDAEDDLPIKLEPVAKAPVKPQAPAPRSITPQPAKRPAVDYDDAVASVPVDLTPLPQTLMTVEDVGGMQVVHVDCPAVRERQAYALTEPLMGIADRSNGKMMLDLTKVAAFSCAWVNVMMSVAKRCKSRGGTMILTGVSTEARHTLRQMGLEKQFTIG